MTYMVGKNNHIRFLTKIISHVIQVYLEGREMKFLFNETRELIASMDVEFQHTLRGANAVADILPKKNEYIENCCKTT